MKLCAYCYKRIWFWEARFTIQSVQVPLDELGTLRVLTEFPFHGECACAWILKALNNHLGAVCWRRVTGWWK